MLSRLTHPALIVETSVQPRLTLALMAMLVCSIGVVGAAPTGLTYLDSTWASHDSEDGDLVAISPDNTIIASVHGDQIFLFNSTTLDKIHSFNVDRVAAIEFSPDGNYLAINKGSTVQIKESIKLIEIATMEILERSALADDKARALAWNPDGDVIAAPGPEGDVELYRLADLSVKDTLHSVHNFDVTCIDYRPNGDNIVTGDESGRYGLWNSNGVNQNYIDLNHGLVDCKFTPDGMDILLLDERGKLISETIDGINNFELLIPGAKQIYLSESGSRMHVSVESDDFRGLRTYDYQTSTEIKNTTFFHKVEDLAFIEDEYSRLQKLYVAGDTGQLAVYLRQSIPEGFNEPGSDLDGDLVPDNLDPDDDGDGIIDEWDDDIGCDAPEGTPCSRYPDLSKIRNIEITIGEQLVIRDRITLPTEDSSNIRNLSRISIAADQVLSGHEADLFAAAMCANIDHGDVIQQWRESVSVSSGELGNGQVTCTLDNGMKMIEQGDSTTQISMSIITTFEFENELIFPLNLTILEQPTPTDGSIGWLAPSHPVSVTIGGERIDEQSIPLWWKDMTDGIVVTLEKNAESEPSTIESAVNIALHPLAFIAYFGILVGLGTLWIRRENKIDIDLDDEHEDEEDDDYEDEDEELDSELSSDVDYEENPVKNRTPPTSRKPPTTGKKKMYSSTMDQAPLVSKKRTVSSNLNKDGPIMKTKRKRLVVDSEPVKTVSKKKVVAKETQTVKTRKVRAQISTEETNEAVNEEAKVSVKKRKAKVNAKSKDEEEKVESTPKKKRKPVKRKKKPSSEKSIDEEKLQDNLVNDFLSED